MTEGKVIPLRRIEGTIDELSDRALVSAVAAGDQAALGALYDRFHRDVYRFVARLAGAHDPSVDDLVQSTFLEAHRSAPRFRGDSAVKTWLFGIAANLVRDHVRGDLRQRAIATRLAAVPTAPGPMPDRGLELEQRRRYLALAVEALSPALKEAYVMCVIEEVPGKDAARALGIREASLWRRLSDARDALRATLEELQR
ncbi:MAG TPA: RNA polymerase sigma factor [Kofleriaceae bacterium]|nr:RNA polymerase sigma factor [Kofleriaceae bacterium]